MPITDNATQATPNPTHNNTIDRVVAKQDPINDEIPIRTLATLVANRGRGLGDFKRSRVETWLFSLVESKRTSTADAATECVGSDVEYAGSTSESCDVAEDGGRGAFTNVIDSLARTHSGLVSS
jgi:hypothetical protein